MTTFGDDVRGAWLTWPHPELPQPRENTGDKFERANELSQQRTLRLECARIIGSSGSYYDDDIVIEAARLYRWVMTGEVPERRDETKSV